TPPPVPPKKYEQIPEYYEGHNSFDGPPVSHKPDKYRSARIDRLETIVGKVADTVGTVADSVGQLTDRMGRMSLNDQPRKPFYCSNCGQEGHKKSNCPTSNP
ncbi:19867_t:CDS:1, partial [Funneliformis geosporum]